jgi:hypothetical protein
MERAALPPETLVMAKSGYRTLSVTCMSWMSVPPASPAQRGSPGGRSSRSVPVTSSSFGPLGSASTRMVRT